MTRVFQLTNFSEGSLACLSGFVRPHVIVYSLPTVRGMRYFKLSLSIKIAFVLGARGTPPMAKVMRKEAWHTQRRDQASGNPLFASIYPQNQSLCTSLFNALAYTSDFMGGCSPPVLLEKE